MEQSSIENSGYYQKQAKIKLNNVFLGFLEGIFIDGQVNHSELKSIIAWIEKYPETVQLNHFENLYDVILTTVNQPEVLNDNLENICSLFVKFKNSDFFTQGVADIQRLHGFIAGLICDGSFSKQELELFKVWLKDKTNLSDDLIYQDIMTVIDLRENDVFSVMSKYVDMNNHGLPYESMNQNQSNPDFYCDSFKIQGHVFCFSGTSANYKKKDWKDIVETNFGVFKDDLSMDVDFLVICNKGNPNWVHMSYGRKFEQAKKWQTMGNNIKIITEDSFLQIIHGLKNEIIPTTENKPTVESSKSFIPALPKPTMLDDDVWLLILKNMDNQQEMKRMNTMLRTFFGM